MTVWYCLLAFVLGGLFGANFIEFSHNTRRERVYQTLQTLQELQELLCRFPEFTNSFEAVETTRQLVSGMKRR